jgi:hypothetical protein
MDIRTAINIVESGVSQEEDPYYYHGTSASYLGSIARKGLLAHKPDEQGWPEYWKDSYSDWDDDDSEGDYDDDAEVEHESLPEEAFEPRLFVMENAYFARQYANNYADGVVLRFRADIEGTDWYEGETDHRYLYTNSNIAPNYIEVLKDDVWVPVTQFA